VEVAAAAQEFLLLDDDFHHPHLTFLGSVEIIRQSRVTVSPDSVAPLCFSRDYSMLPKTLPFDIAYE